MSYVAPVSAVLLMMWTANAATSAGPTTRPIGSVARNSFRRSSSRRSDPKTLRAAPPGRTAHEQQRAPGPHRAGGVAGDVERQHDMAADRVTYLVCGHLE
jgi:hypothetical protein